jgi:hypothetical protein
MDIIQACAVVVMVSFTSVIAVGSLCFVCGMIAILFGKDVD